MVSTVPPAAAPPDEEPDREVTSERMEPSPEPPPEPPLPPDEPPSRPDTAWILGPSNCSFGPITWPTIPLREASPPFFGASIPYCLFISMFFRSRVSTRRVFESIKELIFYNRRVNR